VASSAVGVELLSLHAMPVSWAAMEVKGQEIMHLRLYRNSSIAANIPANE